MAEYFLRRHVHFCCRGYDFVFLDLRQDDYTLVNGKAASALRTVALPKNGDEQPGSLDALTELLEGGLLTTDRNAGKDIRATQTELALESLLDLETPPQARLTVTHVCRFIAACTSAAIRLRWGRLERTVEIVERRKSRYAIRHDFDTNRARELTAAFVKLRAFFPLNYLCLYDSLALLEFLAGYEVFPNWVFGIKLEPWAAHCWVQQGQFVFNEDVEEAAGYTPIMTI